MIDSKLLALEKRRYSNIYTKPVGSHSQAISDHRQKKTLMVQISIFRKINRQTHNTGGPVKVSGFVYFS